MKIFNINISLQQLTSWASEDHGLVPHRKDTVESYLQLMEEFAPLDVFKRAKRLIKDEGVTVDDLSFTVIDESTGVTYPYNPPLDLVFG
jgi:hypothetical protein|tara:strand:- start:10933 stop:11199 length:267 start_codon:yes stop_codon:yes gene_type:complete